MEIINFCKTRLAGNTQLRELIGKEGAARVAIKVGKDLRKRIIEQYKQARIDLVLLPAVGRARLG